MKKYCRNCGWSNEEIEKENMSRYFANKIGELGKESLVISCIRRIPQKNGTIKRIEYEDHIFF